jgi:uncharacterized damage-inducible protein DinB
MQDLRYPIGNYDLKEDVSENQVRKALDDMESAPARMREAVRGLNEEQLNTCYREGGWTIRQVVHHVPDSHMNSYVRMRLALTENEPVIRPYLEDVWAELPDARNADVEPSLLLLEALHRRWLLLLRSLNGTDLQRAFRHPDLGTIPLTKAVCLYGWHGRHHTAQITSLRQRRDW